MDPSRFDTLIRSLTTTGTGSRRGALAALLGGTLGLLGLTDIAARKKSKGKKKKKKNGGNSSSPPPPADPLAPSPTCSDGIQNGDESDVDCGGSCSRCANGQSCRGRNDCAGALCQFERCYECFGGGDCGPDANGSCFCAAPESGGPRVCITGPQTGQPVAACGSCPAGTTCFSYSGQLHCHKRCGA
jgi:hypothetical protein